MTNLDCFDQTNMIWCPLPPIYTHTLTFKMVRISDPIRTDSISIKSSGLSTGHPLIKSEEGVKIKNFADKHSG